MKIYCPYCGVKGSADDSYNGRKVKCPKCQEMFDLKSDMAIEQSELLTADLGGESLAEPSDQGVLQDEGDLRSSLEYSPPEQEDPQEEVETPEITTVEDIEPEDLSVEGGGSIDWDDFGAELDREIFEGERESEASDLLLTEELQAVDAPVAGSIDSADLSGAEEMDVAGSTSVSADVVVNDSAEDLGNTLIDQLAEGADIPVAGEISEPLTARTGEPPVEEADVVETVAVVEEAGEDNNLATLTAPEVVMPLFVDAGKNDQNDAATEAMALVDDDDTGVDVKRVDDPEDAVVVEDEPYGIAKEQCWECGKEDSSGEVFVPIDGRLYCPDCLPTEQADVAGPVVANDLAETEENKENPGEGKVAEAKKEFTVGGVIRESWAKLKGAKGAIWAGTALMYLVLIVLVACGTFWLPTPDIESDGVVGYILPFLLQVVIQIVSMLFIAGLLFMGIRRVAGDEVSWKMIFHGFSFTGKIIVVSILQFIFISVGFILIIPGIYLVVGYTMVIPLIVDKNLSPWEALETSRKAVHKVWWKVAVLYALVMLIFLVAFIPFGIGVIWAWPMIMVTAGVVYRRLFNR